MKRLLIIGAVLIAVVALSVYSPRIWEYLFVPEIVAEGDSLMSGANTSLESIAQKLEEQTGRSWRFTNLATPGDRVGSEISSSQKTDLPIYHLPWKKNDKLWLFAGTNDLGNDAGPEGVKRLLSAVETYFKNAHAVGYEEDNCFYTDILARSSGGNSTFDEDRRSFNSQIQGRLKGLAHVIPSSSNPLLQDPLDKQYFTDGLHLTMRGYEVIAADTLNAMTNGVHQD